MWVGEKRTASLNEVACPAQQSHAYVDWSTNAGQWICLHGAQVYMVIRQNPKRSHTEPGGGLRGGNNRLLRGDGGAVKKLARNFPENENNHTNRQLTPRTVRIHHPFHLFHHILIESKENI